MSKKCVIHHIRQKFLFPKWLNTLFERICYLQVAADLQGGGELDLGHDVVVDSDASGE